jgi:hypothetical protein
MAMTITATEPYVVDGEGVTIDLILWRRFHVATPGVLAELLALPENEHLEQCPAELPVGTVVWLPTAAPLQGGVLPVISLWE